MNIEAFDHVVRRTAKLHERRGSPRADSEYGYWVEWLKDQLVGFEKLKAKDKRRVVSLLMKHPHVQAAVGY